jgi:hypothetical protein
MLSKKTIELAIEGLSIKRHRDDGNYKYKQQQEWIIEHYRRNIEADDTAISELEAELKRLDEKDVEVMDD